MAYSRAQLFELSKKVGRCWRTLQYWAAQGCDLNDSESLNAFLTAKELQKTNVQKAKERVASATPDKIRAGRPSDSAKHTVNGETLLERGNPIEIRNAQEFWLRTAETLRRLDISMGSLVALTKGKFRCDKRQTLSWRSRIG